MAVKNDLGADASSAVAESLQHILAELHLYYARLHNYHWNLEGHSFFTLHAQLQTMYEDAAETIDDIAERILSVGGRPATKLADYVAKAHLKETESRVYNGDEVAAGVLEAIDHLIKQLRELIVISGEHSDEGTADMAIGFLKDFEKLRWMISAYMSR
jgi:starvation-inducible DNA-binding protein